MTFPVNEQNVSVMRIDINALSLSLDLNIFQQDECSCSKLGMEVEYAKSSKKKNTFSNLDDLWVASFCHGRAEYDSFALYQERTRRTVPPWLYMHYCIQSQVEAIEFLCVCDNSLLILWMYSYISREHSLVSWWK